MCNYHSEFNSRFLLTKNHMKHQVAQLFFSGQTIMFDGKCISIRCLRPAPRPPEQIIVHEIKEGIFIH